MTAHTRMEAPLPDAWYWQPEHLERERAGMFYRNWVFAGFADSVAKNNDYLSLTVAGLPVIVRNMKGKLVAFRNICSHRHSTIHPEGCGNAMFRCPYHGWMYNADGVPIGIPDNAKSFGFDKETQSGLALDPVEVETCGRFVFVRVTPGGVSLRKWLGKLFEPLSQASKLFNKIYAAPQPVWNCNWKIGLEITVEGYHLPYVHTTSFENHIGGSRVGEELEPEIADIAKIQASYRPDDYGQTEFVGAHSTNYAPLSESSMQHLTAVAERLRLPRSTTLTGYDHFLIYPNLMIGVNGGTNMCIERYEPLDADHTRVECWLATGSPADEKLYDGIIWRTMTRQWKDWTLSVLAEDQTACEATQTGVRFASRPSVLGRAEERVHHLQSMWREELEQDAGTKDKTKGKAA